MRRTGNISSLPAIAMKCEPTVNGVLTLLPARPGVAQPATAPTVIAAADWITARRLFCGMASSWSGFWRVGSLAPQWAKGDSLPHAANRRTKRGKGHDSRSGGHSYYTRQAGGIRRSDPARHQDRGVE